MKTKVYGIDLDGTVTPFGLNNQKRAPPWWLWYFLTPLLFMSMPKKAVVRKMWELKTQGHKLIIITSRPKESFRLTRFLLDFFNVPFDGLFCVGYGKGVNERKLKIIREVKMDKFIDSDRRVVEFMKRNGVDAVTSLEKVFEKT